MCDEITYPFLNSQGVTGEVVEWLSKFIHILLGMWLLIHAVAKCDFMLNPIVIK